MPNLTRKARSPFRRVLFACNFSAGSEGALLAAFHFCQMNKASLRILHVCKTHARPVAERGQLLNNGTTAKAALLLLRGMKKRAVELGLSCTTHLVYGVSSEKILEALDFYKIDIAILGTSEPRGSKPITFGHTAERVMRKAACPIITVGLVAADLETTDASGGPVVFATDFHAVTRQAIHPAVSYCKSADLHLHCLHVLPRTIQPAHGDQTLPEILTGALKHLVASCSVKIVEPVFRVTFGSEISNAVVEYARQQEASLIFLGVHRASIFSPNDPLPIVYRIITEAPCPVVTILFDAEPDPECAVYTGAARSNVPHVYIQ